MSFKQNIPNKIMPIEELMRWVHLWRVQGKKITFTNGCFDILHKGHVEYLNEAADLGSEFIVGLNSDASVKLLEKGANRPIQDQESRAHILASLACVSAVCLFDEETPENLIREISPDVLAKGGDYNPEQIAGAEFVQKNGGEVAIIPLTEGYSTTSIANKIKEEN